LATEQKLQKPTTDVVENSHDARLDLVSLQCGTHDDTQFDLILAFWWLRQYRSKCRRECWYAPLCGEIHFLKA
jgi:hypothetical protein